MSKFLSDIEISQNSKKEDIAVVAKKIGLTSEQLIKYGDFKAKIDFNKISSHKDGKLILVTAMNPTPAGEGKTTTTIGLNDGFVQAGFKSIIAMREASLGPVFGAKGGAAGGGKSQVVPIEDINLHFTGDLHAITSANNLISSVVDNSLYYGNDLKIKSIVWKRCMDVNDRSLRNITIHSKVYGDLKTSFQITAASEIMAILCLSQSMKDLEERLNKAIVAYNEDDKPIFVKDLNIVGSLLVLLKDAMNPNLVQTVENNPALVHGGPFANIAHGCNTIIATKSALKLADYVVTEAGFGSDLGAEKFFNIKCRIAKIKPSAVVLVATVKALKMHGGVKLADLKNENIEGLKQGLENLTQHLKSLRTFNIPVVVALNDYITDTDSEKNVIQEWAKTMNVPFSISKAWELGGKGTLDLVDKVINATSDKDIHFTYDINDPIESKILKVAQNIYGADGIEISNLAKEKINQLVSNKLDKQLICIAKTQSSFSDQPTLLGAPKNWKLQVKDINLSNGAGFIVVICGTITTMPGLRKYPQATKIGFKNNRTVGLS